MRGLDSNLRHDRCHGLGGRRLDHYAVTPTITPLRHYADHYSITPLRRFTINTTPTRSTQFTYSICYPNSLWAAANAMYLRVWWRKSALEHVARAWLLNYTLHTSGLRLRVQFIGWGWTNVLYSLYATPPKVAESSLICFICKSLYLNHSFVLSSCTNSKIGGQVYPKTQICRNKNKFYHICFLFCIIKDMFRLLKY